MIICKIVIHHFVKGIKPLDCIVVLLDCTMSGSKILNCVFYIRQTHFNAYWPAVNMSHL